MSILKDNVIPQTPAQPKDARLSRVSETIKNMSSDIFNTLINTQRRGIDIVWNNPGLTPQEIIDELGDDAIKVFQFHGKLSKLIVELAAIGGVSVDLKSPTNDFTISDKGKITVTSDPYLS